MPNFAIIQIEEINFAEYVPQGKKSPTELHIMIKLKRSPIPLVMRIKSRRAADEMIDALIKHRDGIWPNG